MAARKKQEAAAQILTAPLVGAAGQLPKLDLFYLFRRYLTTHGGGLQIDTKVIMSITVCLVASWRKQRCRLGVLACSLAPQMVRLAISSSCHCTQLI
jgi:hypothetical protein